MFYKKNNSYTIWVALSLIALALVTTVDLTVFIQHAVSKKDGGSTSTTNSKSSSEGGGFTIGGTSSSSTTTSNALTKKELSR